MGTPLGPKYILYSYMEPLGLRASLQLMLCFGEDSECCDWGFGVYCSVLKVEGPFVQCNPATQCSHRRTLCVDVCINSWHHVV